MPCAFPLKGWKAKAGGITFSLSNAYTDLPVEVPCGQCMLCRIARRDEWATRCVHEAQLHEQSCFLTLTYRDNPLSLDKSELQKFFKRLRKKVGKVRYFACGEYGEKTSRPHYHALIFGWSPDDVIDVGDGTQVSQSLEDIWTHGNCRVGAVSFASAGYVAKYCLKGKRTESLIFDPATGEAKKVAPEFSTMSRRPGIGAAWADKYQAETVRDDYVVVDGYKRKPPKYYDKRLDDDVLFDIKAMRALRGGFATPDELIRKDTVKRVLNKKKEFTL